MKLCSGQLCGCRRWTSGRRRAAGSRRVDALPRTPVLSHDSRVIAANEVDPGFARCLGRRVPGWAGGCPRPAHSRVTGGAPTPADRPPYWLADWKRRGCGCGSRGVVAATSRLGVTRTCAVTAGPKGVFQHRNHAGCGKPASTGGNWSLAFFTRGSGVPCLALLGAARQAAIPPACRVVRATRAWD